MKKVLISIKRLSKRKSPTSGWAVIYNHPVAVVPPYIGLSPNLTKEYIEKNIENPSSGVYASQLIGGDAGISPEQWKAKFIF